MYFLNFFLQSQHSFLIIKNCCIIKKQGILKCLRNREFGIFSLESKTFGVLNFSPNDKFSTFTGVIIIYFPLRLKRGSQRHSGNRSIFFLNLRKITIFLIIFLINLNIINFIIPKIKIIQPNSFPRFTNNLINYPSKFQRDPSKRSVSVP